MKVLDRTLIQIGQHLNMPRRTRDESYLSRIEPVCRAFQGGTKQVVRIDSTSNSTILSCGEEDKEY